MNSAKHLTISGRVQGVSYRAWFSGQAQKLRLNGWVRNRQDGSVEAVIHGPQAELENIIAAAHNGPTLAKVEKVMVKDTDYNGPNAFEVRPTA